MEFFITDFNSLIHISVFDSDLFSPNGNYGNLNPRYNIVIINIL